MKFKRDDLAISTQKYAQIIGVDKSDMMKIMELKKVPTDDKGDFKLNEAIEAVSPHIQREEIKKKVHAFFISKGGTGKTLNCYNFANFLALLGYKVLMIDLDPQVNLTTQCGFEFEEMEGEDDILSILKGSRTITESIQHISYNVDLIKGSERIGEAEAALASKISRNSILDTKFRNENIRQKYDFIFYDNHSSASVSSNNAMMTSDSIISVVNPDRFSFNGIAPVMATVEDLKTAFNKDVGFSILINNFDPTVKGQKTSVEMIASEYGRYLLNNFVKKSSDFTNSTLLRQPFFSFCGHNSNAIKDYLGLMDEFINLSAGNLPEIPVTSNEMEQTHGPA